VIRRNKKKPIRASRSPFAHLWHELANMPPLNHWPDRPLPYLPDHSEVLNWLADQCGCDMQVAEKIFEAARNKQVITFDPDTRLWCGTRGGRP
jgi:hypothetical protein